MTPRPAIRRPGLKIRTQIILPFLLLMVILGVVGTYLTTSLVASSLERRIADQLVVSEDAALNEAVRVQGEELAAIRLIANTEGVSSAVAGGDQAALKRLIVPLEVNNRLGGIKVFDVRGRTILEVDQPDAANPAGLVYRSGTDLSADPLVAPVIAGLYDALGDKYIGYVGTPPSQLAATGPVISGDRVVGGVLITTPLSAVLADMRSQSLASVALFDRSGHLIGTTLRGMPASVLDERSRAYLDLASPGRAQRRTVHLAGDAYEIQFTNFYLRQRPAGYLGIALSRIAVTAAGQQSALQMTLLFSGVVLILLLIGYVLALRLTRPIDDLLVGTRAVARGDLTRRVTVRRGDELGELGAAFNAMTTDLQDRTRALNEQMRRLAALYQTSEGLGRGGSEGAIAEAILSVSLKALGLDQAFLVSKNAETQLLEMSATVGLSAQAVSRLSGLSAAKLGHGLDLGPDAIPQHLAITGEERPALRAFGQLTGLAQGLVVPLVRGGANAGYLLVGVPSAQTLPEPDVALLQTIATEMALTLENAELKRTTALQAHRLDQAIVALEKISQALTAVTVGTDNLLRAVAHAAAEILEVPYASIHLRKEEWHQHFADVIVGSASRREIAGVRASGNFVASRVERPEQLLEADFTEEGVGAVASARRIGLHGAVGVAMALDGEIAGVLVIHLRAPRRLHRSEVRVLQTLANQAVIAIENAEAYEATKQLATTDSMTGVANHREFESRLERELQRARRSREPMALLMCDLDHFKQINDTAGHPAGDAVLRYLTQEILVPMVRPKDLVARYGGDEFVILLRGADGRAAAAIAERIRKSFSANPLIYEGTVISNLSLSLGLATFPRDGETRETLVQAADQALYVAKRGGRNRVARRDDTPAAEQSAG